ncbi:hypothetical protein [Thalassotalea sp. G20_0]|uniref:hypothetical protein n=1 Tax=Thalassotalea sp. G20_0 TaxID=2821093 RepID=UPI001ADD001E|nr:hypothetical protein [Thalassotalea sp. G20_0]
MGIWTEIPGWWIIFTTCKNTTIQWDSRKRDAYQKSLSQGYTTSRAKIHDKTTIFSKPQAPLVNNARELAG